jgi:topoisomerase-4 subunit A
MTTLTLYTDTAYLDYSMSVITNRAIPSLSDGQKPVHRRILYAMHEMHLLRSPGHIKSARVVGNVIGQWHPHGDVAVYEAMVRMAQDFSLRYPLVDGQGNFGSRDGDGAAAMRYTEARLTPIAELLLSELEEGTVDFRNNYDGSAREPVTLPARLPFVLLNGATGIAVGLSTDIPSHNLNEIVDACVALINDPSLSDDALLDIIPGPDFATGAQIITPPSVIRDIYRVGRGTLRVRARWTIEELARGDWRIVIYELPPNVAASTVMSEIEHIVNPQAAQGQDKGKGRSGDRSPLKPLLLSLIENIRDESGKDAAMRLVIEPKSRRTDPQQIIDLLLAHTSLEANVAVNCTIIDSTGNAPCMPLADILRQWVAFRISTVRRRTQFRLDNTERRIHILEGRALVILHIDEVIRIIRNSDDPKVALIEAFGLSEVQADDILDMPLRRLARLAGIELDAELASKRSMRDDLVTLLNNDSALRELIVTELRADQATYGDARRTVLEAATSMSARAVSVPVVSDPVTVIVSAHGWARTRSGHDIDVTAIDYKTGDSYWHHFQCSTSDSLAVLDSTGQVYSISVSAIPGGKGDGVPLTSLISLTPGAHIVDVLYAPDDTKCLVVSDAGYGFVTPFGGLATRHKSGKVLLTLSNGAQPLPMVALPGDDPEVALVSSDNRMLVISTSSINELAKGKGVKLMQLAPQTRLIQCALVSSADLAVAGDVIDHCRGSRATKGVVLRTTRGGRYQLPL